MIEILAALGIVYLILCFALFLTYLTIHANEHKDFKKEISLLKDLQCPAKS
jgi:hypothetical protein